ncbi:MAG: SpoIIE family protein phosphatase [bacterium]|nr:SpoIIE family protein phosphatase [bacterium]
MNFFDTLNYNFFSIGALIPTLFDLFLAYLFLRTIPNKSKSTIHMGIGFIYLALFNLGYFISGSFYHPGAVFHRWLTVGTVVLFTSHFNMFVYYLEEDPYPRLGRGLLIGQYIVALVITAIFIIFTSSTDIVYHFAGHYWDFDADGPSKIVGVFVFLTVFLFAGLMLWKLLKVRRRRGWMILSMGITYILATLVPSMANFLSRTGSLDRGTYQVTWDLFNILGFSLLGVIYINYTKDRTSFMAKIVGISLVTMLVVLQGFSYSSFKENENNYDMAHQLHTRFAVKTDYRAADTEYIAAYSLKEGFKQLFRRKDASENIQINPFRSGVLNTLMWERIRQASGSEGILSALKESHYYFSGYANTVRNYLDSQASQTSQTSELSAKVLGFVEKSGRKMLTRSNKIQKLPNAGFRSELSGFLEKTGDAFSPFKKAILAHLAVSKHEGTALKEDVLSFLAPLSPPGIRHYREFKGKHYIAYHQVDLKKNLVYEAGFSYLAYRKHLHPIATKYVLMLAGVLLAVLLGFRFFFLGALLYPLGALLDGLSEVRDGNFDIQIRVKVEDEIGTITHNFNEMVRGIKSARMELDDHAGQLENVVTERTAALRKTLEQQDGDYFLTSLLLEPLGRNQAALVDVSVDFFIKEKKQFKFRKWEKEIGGDICISHNLFLKGKLYAVFLNADAMGKSIQGAGGALVLGTGLKAIIDRTRFSSIEQEQYPELWIKRSYFELQRVFETFDGSMLISMVMGLVDDETGLIYYVNVEHPWTVLYRNKKAQFIENELVLRKLGVPHYDERSFGIKTFQMKRGDVVIAGSDGRDDILLGDPGDTNREINEDENLFLSMVEAGKGDLADIHRNISLKGDLTDDLSLLRITFRETDETSEKKELFQKEESSSLSLDELLEALKSNRFDYVLLKEIAKQMINNKDYKNVLSYLETYIELRPDDTEYIYYASFCLMKAGKLQKAGELGERAHLRKPGNIRYLVHLAKVYMQEKNYIEADILLDEVLKLEPDNPKALKLKDSL